MQESSARAVQLYELVLELPLLAADDEMLRAWFTRSLDLHGGLGREARMKPLFE